MANQAQLKPVIFSSPRIHARWKAMDCLTVAVYRCTAMGRVMGLSGGMSRA